MFLFCLANYHLRDLILLEQQASSSSSSSNSSSDRRDRASTGVWSLPGQLSHKPANTAPSPEHALWGANPATADATAIWTRPKSPITAPALVLETPPYVVAASIEFISRRTCREDGDLLCRGWGVQQPAESIAPRVPRKRAPTTHIHTPPPRKRP